MSEPLHIEGMGLLGSMLARRLHEEGIGFTWNDTEDKFTAWPVSTGLAYPDGNADNQRGLERWHEILDGDLAPEAEAVPYAFAHKAPPHSGGYLIAADYGPLRLAEPLAVALNVPEFVRTTRLAFELERREQNPPGAEVVVAHTTPERGDGYLWGWAARVTFDLLPALAADCFGVKPALYAKAHRFNLTYAYPIPGTDTWWAGSVLQMQRRPKAKSDAEVMKLFLEWEANARRLLHVTNVDLHEHAQGWRPRFRAGDSGHVERTPTGWSLPPMPTDGMRRGWLVVDELIDRLMLS